MSRRPFSPPTSPNALLVTEISVSTQVCALEMAAITSTPPIGLILVRYYKSYTYICIYTFIDVPIFIEVYTKCRRLLPSFYPLVIR